MVTGCNINQFSANCYGNSMTGRIELSLIMGSVRVRPVTEDNPTELFEITEGDGSLNIFVFVGDELGPVIQQVHGDMADVSRHRSIICQCLKLMIKQFSRSMIRQSVNVLPVIA